jgi:hypothetical protein
MRSLQQREASRRNGRNSRGPKTVQGKNRSRLNALKDGFAARTVFHPDDLAAMPGLIDIWNELYEPADIRDDLQIMLAAHATSRLLRLTRFEQQALASRLADVEHDFDDQQGFRLGELQAQLPSNPPVFSFELERFPDGLAWKIQELKHLRECLRRHERYSAEELMHLLRLFGLPTDPDCPHRLRYFLVGYHLQIGGGRSETILRYCPLRVPPHKATAEVKQQGISGINHFLEQELARLEKLRDSVQARHERARAQARQEALLDTSRAGQLRLRYERAALHDLRRAQAHLDRHARRAATNDDADDVLSAIDEFDREFDYDFTFPPKTTPPRAAPASSSPPTPSSTPATPPGSASAAPASSPSATSSGSATAAAASASAPPPPPAPPPPANPGTSAARPAPSPPTPPPTERTQAPPAPTPGPGALGPLTPAFGPPKRTEAAQS